MPAFDEVEHDRWRGKAHKLFAGENHPCPDETRSWIDIAKALPAELHDAALRWGRELASIRGRRGFYPLSRALPGGHGSNSDPVVMAVGKALEPEIERLVGRKVWVSQATATIHWNGVPTVRHRDVGYYRYFVAWPVCYDVDDGWPIHVERRGENGSVAEDVMDNSSSGRALLFAGHDVHHWRAPYHGEKALSFFMRYTAYEPVRSHTQREVDEIAAAGIAELQGTPVDWDALESIRPMCTSQDLVTRERNHVVLRGLFSGEELEAATALRHSMLAWPPSFQHRLYQAVKDTGPLLRTGCGFAGHEHELAIETYRGSPKAEWRRDVDANPRHRTRIAVCVDPQGCREISFKDEPPVRLEFGDAVLWRSDLPYVWRESTPQITGMFGLPEGFLERWAEAA